MIKYKRKKQADIKAILENGIKGDFWEILKLAINENIEAERLKLRSEELRKSQAEQYKLETEIINSKIDYLEYMKELPDLIAQEMGSPDNSTQDFDPYPH